MNPAEVSAARLVVLGLLGGSAAAAVGSAFGVPMWLPASTAAFAVLEADVMWRVARSDVRFGWSRFRRIVGELAVLYAIVVVARTAGSQDIAATVGGWPSGFVTGEATLVFAITLAVWFATSSTLDDLGQLGELSDRTSSEFLPVPRLRWRYLAGGAWLAVAGAIGLTGWRGLIEISRPLTGGVIWPALVYFPLGAVAVGRARLHDAGIRWRRERVDTEQLDVAGRRGALIAAAALLAGMLLFAPAQDGAPAVRAVEAGVALVGRVGQAVLEAMAGWFERDPLETDTTVPVLEGLPVTVPGEEPVIEPGEPLISTRTLRALQRIAFWTAVLVAGTVVVRVLWRARDDLVRSARRVRADRGWRAAWMALPGQMWRAVLASVRGWLRRRHRADAASPPVTPTARRARRAGAGRWQPAGRTAQRVVAAYRDFVRQVSAVVGAPQMSETAGEYGIRVASHDTRLAVAAEHITRLYEEARYSDHVLGDRAARDAAAAVGAVRSVLGDR